MEIKDVTKRRDNEIVIHFIDDEGKYQCLRAYPNEIIAWRNAAEHSVQRTVEACPDDRHMYYTAFLNYEFCPYCGQRLHSR